MSACLPRVGAAERRAIASVGQSEWQAGGRSWRVRAGGWARTTSRPSPPEPPSNRSSPSFRRSLRWFRFTVSSPTRTWWSARSRPCRACYRRGSVAATALWVLATIAFTIYVSKVGSYDKTYGSLGAVIILLLWFYLTAYVILVGAELNAEIEC